MRITRINMHQEVATHVDDIPNRQRDIAHGHELDDHELEKTQGIGDDALLLAQEYRIVMNRQLNWIAVLRLAYSFTSSWFNYLVSEWLCAQDRMRKQINSLNWKSVVVVGSSTIMLSFWFISGKREFERPGSDWGLLQAARRAT